ncbi:MULTISPECIES: ABC transporter ATP-binding protein [unclassified Cryobacterium]|uniref:ABC transporter ATP-binding protein n=1 Tax=unclassified Cryobacterium TaxID=2649013 RepID=UPI00106A9602|nr:MULTISPECIES: ABC transporter ATP-binding protein [unclassified Cryobacterium]TFC51076.1 ABC transporter ATP-binding protein [Cryobacterium sp. TMB3-1-2]TFC74422.1 ABC transporter ATP-binding protein [Cryobacterium sp. TMB3-15]TFC79935.1 ABC transporter ATP-binding protein [Cryobacterium sp. TMB3-10]TFD41836.1 ABC transporter ATP-binding protein [Cryobacterium sp. TMB3-12]
MTLHLSGISKSFGATEVLRDVTLEVPDGTRIALVGASGSGKSTLLRLIAGFERPDTGTITHDGREIAGPRSSLPAHLRGIGYVAQDGALFPHLSVARNIAFGLPRAARNHARVRELMEFASLDARLAARMPHELSGGQQQRVALVRALAQRPKVILLDEPFSALDTGLRAQTRQAVVDMLELSDVTAILVTHDRDEALSFGQQVGVLAGGRLVQAGTPATVFDSPIDARVAEFLGDVVLVPARPAGADAVDCALGRLPVRHDRSGAAATLFAMVRPEQLRLAPAADGGNATVINVRSTGAGAELTLAFDGGEFPAEATHRVPLHAAAQFTAGRSVQVSVDGGVVLYPQPGAPGQKSALSTPRPAPVASVAPSR